MVKFLIQTINGSVVHDFSFHLIKSIDFNNWSRGNNDYSYKLTETIYDVPGYIPVGSLEFVFEYLKECDDINVKFIKPINIPEELNNIKYLGRECYIADKGELLSNNEELFIKSDTQYKKFTEFVTDKSVLDEDSYLVSEIVEFESEWRSFVHLGELVGLNNYSGDFTLMPDIQVINEMIKNYSKSPLAFTLDVGIIEGKTVLIEVHPFVSCGLYGFSDYGKLAQMFIQGYNFMKKEARYLKNLNID